MPYEYKVIPAPSQTDREMRRLPAAERLAATMTTSINEMARDGWEYLRTETMTVEDKKGRFAKVEEVIETVLVFRRPASVAHNIYQESASPKPVSEATAAAQKVDVPPPAPAERPARQEPSLGSTSNEDRGISDPDFPVVGGVSR